jgi:hypothetical protein
MIGDGVEEFGDPPCRKTALEGLGVESILIDGQALDVGLETPEGHDGPQIGGALHQDQVARVEEGLRQELQSFDGPAGNQELPFLRTSPLQLLQSLSDEGARAGEPGSGGVLHGRGVPGGDEPLEDLGKNGAGERGGVGESP